MKNIFTAFLVLLAAGGTFLMVSCDGGGDGSSPVVRLAFYSSTDGPADFSSWPDASGSGLSGLDAADAICNARAAAAGLDGSFVAWLSDDADDAYCRIHGLTGKKAGNCGQAALPVSAGPWFRTDGQPFSGGIGDLVTSRVIYHPVKTDEFGSTFDLFEAYWTGTDQNGVLELDNCSNWSDSTSAGTINFGGTYATVYRFTEGLNTLSCSNDFHLLCLETGSNNVSPAPADTGLIVFISSTSGNGNLGSWAQAGGETGILAGDNICQELASTSGLSNPGSFKAWLSDSTTDARDRLVSDGPWVRVDGVQVAANRSALISSWLQTSIAVTEEGDYVWRGVWTGTLQGGTKSASACSDWNLGIGSAGQHGDTSHIDAKNWTESPEPPACNSSFGLYCFED